MVYTLSIHEMWLLSKSLSFFNTQNCHLLCLQNFYTSFPRQKHIFSHGHGEYIGIQVTTRIKTSILSLLAINIVAQRYPIKPHEWQGDIKTSCWTGDVHSGC